MEGISNKRFSRTGIDQGIEFSIVNLYFYAVVGGGCDGRVTWSSLPPGALISFPAVQLHSLVRTLFLPHCEQNNLALWLQLKRVCPLPPQRQQHSRRE